MQEVLEKWFKINHDTSATVIITLAIFILGYLVTAAVYTITKAAERRTRRKMFVHNLRSLLKSITRQQQGFQTTIEALDITTNTPWEYPRVEFFQPQVLREMGYGETFKSFFLGLENQWSPCVPHKLRRRAFTKVWESISSVQFWSERALNDFPSVLALYNQHGDKRNAAVNDLKQQWESILLNVESDPTKFTTEELQFCEKLFRLIVDFKKIPTRLRVNAFTTHRKIVLPIRILCKKNQSLAIARALNEKALAASIYYQEMELLARHTRNQYQHYYHAFRAFEKTTAKALQILR